MIYIQVNEKKGKNLNSNSNHTDIKIKKKKITKNKKKDNNIINKKEMNQFLKYYQNQIYFTMK